MVERAPPPDALLSRRALFENPARLLPRISPSGEEIAFIAPHRGVLNVWVAPADDPSGARVVTGARSWPIRDFAWAETSQHLFYLDDQDGDERFHLFVVALESGDVRDLTPFAGARAEGLETYPAHPRSVSVSLNARDERFADPVVIDIESGAVSARAANTLGFARFVFDRDAQIRLAVKIEADGSGALFVPDPDHGGFRRYAEIPVDDVRTTTPSHVGSDGRTLYLRDSRGRGASALVAVDLTRAAPGSVLFEDPGADVEDLLADPASGAPQAVATNAKRRVWHLLDEALRSDLDALRDLGGDGWITSRSRDDRRWIMASVGDDRPARYYLWDRRTQRRQYLFCDRPGLEGVRLAKMRPETIAARDGLPLTSYLSLPSLRGGPHPMVLLVHGGPWDRDRWGLCANHQWLANRGYAVLSVNFRGSVGLGKSVFTAGDREWAGKMHDDLIDAVDWAVAGGIADRAKVGIMGTSYGGYASSIGLTHTPRVFACGIAVAAPSDLASLLESIPAHWEPVRAELVRRVGDPSAAAERARLFERSPISRVDSVEKPLLMAQGANDPRVRKEDTDRWVDALSRAGAAVTYLVYPDEGHRLARPENRCSFNAVAELFLSQHLGGRCEPAGDDLRGSSITIPVGAERIGALPRVSPGAPR